ncbi:hypothetical protein DGM85_23450 (plasmid) [Xanthomonas phaseoli pv. phaseoli]|nr:hypothetical protein DGN11_22940 [Xanthomonas citri pv. fuscans]QWN27157.1 hypothetical protein DGM93_23405 [Xanthomonas phaseoli pv. phaseoli]QWN31325.1 hypothetical protein DGM85_23450 [Xanthomonas phaseoli pv. phaseoli]QWN35466.1 hypothetical protein DGM81_23155 [Xanthomonas phaseoli pv. phaseoli]
MQVVLVLSTQHARWARGGRAARRVLAPPAPAAGDRTRWPAPAGRRLEPQNHSGTHQHSHSATYQDDHPVLGQRHAYGH